MTLVAVSPKVGPRTFQVKFGNGVRTQVLNPGQEAELDLINEDDPVLLGMVDLGEVRLGSDKPKSGKKQRDDENELRSQIAELEAKLAQATLETNELRFKLDPSAHETRARAEAAGATPGYADPLPPGTDTEGGKEAQAAREATGADLVEEQRQRQADALQRASQAAADSGKDLGPGAPGAGTMSQMELQPHEAGRHAPRERAKPKKSKD